MNSTCKRCSVENCEGYKRFLFPKSMELRKKWLKAIRKPNLVVKSSYGLCDKHFDPADMLTQSVTGGYSMNKVRLKTNSVPCIFPWDLKDGEKSNVLMVNDKVPFQDVDGCDLETIENMDIDSDCNLDDQPQSVLKLPASVPQLGLEVYEQTCIATALELENKDRLTSANEIKSGSTSDSPTDNKDSYKKKSTVSIQTQGFPRYNIDDFKHKPQALNHFTGLNYTKFMTVLHTLGPVKIHFEKIEKTKIITIPNQLFLDLWKLRRSTCNLELSEHFNVSVVNMSDIFNVWISVMSKTWSLIDIWPSRELVDFYMPHVFRNNYPKARVTLDATEIKIDAPSNPKLKQSTFSTYKNCNTLKVMVGTSPGGLISHISTPYGGSTSDRQIIERSDLREKCQTGDVILADKGIMVQDLFAPCNVTVSTPTPLVSGSLPHKTIMKDRNLSKHRVHVERIIGLMKTYTILSKKLTRDLLPLASEIIQVCVMLTNFKDNIM